MAKTKSKLRIPYGQAVHDDKETQAVSRVINARKTIIGPETEKFEASVAKLFGKKYGIMVNSGSSANLISTILLDLPKGSEVITPILTFSTTVAPLVMQKLTPVFADVEPGRYVINVDHIEKLITKKTRALMIPLLLGNVPDMKRIRTIARKHKLYFIEDSCDTLGPTIDCVPTGKFSDITTCSFYGSHIITAGGGGGILMVNKVNWRDKAKVLRGWGRSSSLFDESESIEKRFRWKLEGIDYDAKFIFGEIGYNFMPMEIGQAFGNAQLKKLSKFRKTRERNFASLYKFFTDWQDYFILPDQDKEVRTQWLAFPLTIKKSAPFNRLTLATYLEKNNVQTRPIFTGNILRQPAYKNIKHRKLRGGYPITDEVMAGGIVVGCHHGLEKKHISRLKELFSAFLSKHA